MIKFDGCSFPTVSGRIAVSRPVARRFRLARLLELSTLAIVDLALGASHPDFASLLTHPPRSSVAGFDLVLLRGRIVYAAVCFSFGNGVNFAYAPPFDADSIDADYAMQMVPRVSIRIPAPVDVFALHSAKAHTSQWQHESERDFHITGPLSERDEMVAALRACPDGPRMRVSLPDHEFVSRDRQLPFVGAAKRWLAGTGVILALMLAVTLPPYVVLEIVDWLPEIEHHKHIRKIRYIEQIQASIRRVKDAS